MLESRQSKYALLHYIFLLETVMINLRSELRQSKHVLLHDISLLETVMESRDLTDDEITSLF
jgi:hypothetical protein